VQDGHIPVKVESIEDSITLNGVAVESNLAAFAWGRRWAHDPTAVELAASETPTAPTVVVPSLGKALAARVNDISRGLGTEVRELLVLFAGDLVGYQDQAYAERFLGHVEDAVTHERRVAPDSSALTLAVARSLHKLMAYKDEYEVARLMLAPEAKQALGAIGGPNAKPATTKMTWHLHPPMLKALGMQRKVGLGQWSRPAFVALRAGKRLRGSRLDPFGQTKLRRIERVLADEYIDAMTTVFGSLLANNLGDLNEAIEIALLPDQVRGYEELKLTRIRDYRAELANRLHQRGRG
jgi:indolepyruvate ferredoxin oxidoreductase